MNEPFELSKTHVVGRFLEGLFLHRISGLRHSQPLNGIFCTLMLQVISLLTLLAAISHSGPAFQQPTPNKGPI